MKSRSKTREELLEELIVLCGQLSQFREVEPSIETFEPSFQITHQQCLDIIEFLPDPTFVIDREKNVIAWNRAIEEMTGTRKKDILGQGDYAYSIPFYGVRRPIIIDLVIGVEVELDDSYRFIHKDGDTFYAEVFSPRLNDGKGAYLWGKASPIFDGFGRQVGAIESIRDITERSQAEDALRKSEEKFRMLVDTMNEGLAVQDENGLITYANDKLCQLMGYTRSEILGLPEIELVDKSSHRLFFDQIEKRRRGERTHYEIDLIAKGGRKVPVVISGSPIFDERGSYRGTIGVVTDVTERRDAERKKRESEAKYRMIFENSPLGIFHFDAEGVVTACNENIVKIWGSSRERFLGLNLLTSIKNKKMRAAVSECLSGRSAHYEGNYLSVTGSKISNLKADYGPVLAEDGAVLGGIAITEDISERKHAEDALHESEKRLRLLSAQLLNTQEQERKRISRELRDSIGASLISLKFGLESALRDVSRGTTAHESLEALIDMTEDAIKESRRIITDLRPSILDELGLITTIDWYCRKFREVDESVKIDTRIDVEEYEIPEPLKIVIFRVVQESFLNIAKHSKAGAVSVSMTKRGETTLELAVRDDGVGFDPDSTLFADDERKGFGLAGMKERVELSGGAFVVQSSEGSGTVIAASWPLRT